MKNTILANSEDKCHCCGRVHRKLFWVDGHWLGRNCAEDYRIYKYTNSDATSIFWVGYEKKHAQVKKMVQGHS